jgi:methionyl-tRNA formyltransferase
VLRVAFLGTSEFALPSLRGVAERFELVAVVTQPDRPAGRGRHPTPPPVKRLALDLRLPVHQPERVRAKEFVRTLRALAPDVIVVSAYGQLLPKAMLELAPFGCINVHPSLLPKYRGAAPIQWALWNGETETGVTLIQLDEGEDSGPVLRQQAVAIGPDETAPVLGARLAALGGEMLVAVLASLGETRPPATPQEDSRATRAPRLDRAMGQVDWSLPAGTIYNRFRACVPWPGTFTHLQDGTRLRILECRPLAGRFSDAPGSLSLEGDHLLVQAGEGLLQVGMVQPESRSPMSPRAWIAGFRGRMPQPSVSTFPCCLQHSEA